MAGNLARLAWIHALYDVVLDQSRDSRFDFAPVADETAVVNHLNS